VSISHERIYQHIWQDKRRGGKLYRHLPQSGKRRKKYGSKDKRGQLANRVSIEERPKIVDEKSRLGDWEIDTVIGKNHQRALVTIVEQVSKFTLIEKVDNKQSDTVTAATITLLKPYQGDKLFTITADNGKEFAGHEKIAQALDLKVYFAHPYSSWERGVNENTNGLIRQYFPKGSCFEGITEADVGKVMERLNHRPRKTLNYKTPFEVFFENSYRMRAGIAFMS
jgi:IS30 family transposase